MPRVRKETLSTELVCPSNVLTQVKSATAHSFTVPSPDPVATHCMKGTGGRGSGGMQRYLGENRVELRAFWRQGELVTDTYRIERAI